MYVISYVDYIGLQPVYDACYVLYFDRNQSNILPYIYIYKQIDYAFWEIYAKFFFILTHRSSLSYSNFCYNSGTISKWL